METTLNNKFFDFEKAKVQTLSLDQLARTHKENDIYGKPLRGIYHYDLLNQIIGMCNAQNYDVEVYDLFAAQNKDRNTPGVVLLPQVEEQYGERDVEAHILRRVFANIRITNFDDADHTTNLAVAFHQKGIQVGFGNMVMICHNQCMLCADQYISTYSEKGSGRGNGVTIPEVLDIVKSWIIDARRIVVTEREKIERMKQIPIDAQQMFTLIGMLTALREKWKTNSDYMVNRRFIVPRICDYDARWPSAYVKIAYYGGGYARDIDDVVKAMCYLTGCNYDDFSSLNDFVSRLTMNWGQWYEWGFFRIRGYKKGTMHFEFVREEDWMKFNIEVARIKGWQLPKQRTSRK